MSDFFLQAGRASRSNSMRKLLASATHEVRKGYGVIQLRIGQFRVDLAECCDAIDAELLQEEVDAGEPLFLAAFGQGFFGEDVEAIADDGSIKSYHKVYIKQQHSITIPPHVKNLTLCRRGSQATIRPEMARLARCSHVEKGTRGLHAPCSFNRSM